MGPKGLGDVGAAGEREGDGEGSEGGEGFEGGVEAQGVGGAVGETSALPRAEEHAEEVRGDDDAHGDGAVAHEEPELSQPHDLEGEARGAREGEERGEAMGYGVQGETFCHVGSSADMRRIHSARVTPPPVMRVALPLSTWLEPVTMKWRKFGRGAMRSRARRRRSV